MAEENKPLEKILFMTFKIKKNHQYKVNVKKGVYEVYGIPSKNYNPQIKDSKLLDRLEIKYYTKSRFGNSELKRIVCIKDEKDLETARKKGIPQLVLYNIKRTLKE